MLIDYKITCICTVFKHLNLMSLTFV